MSCCNLPEDNNSLHCSLAPSRCKRCVLFSHRSAQIFDMVLLVLHPMSCSLQQNVSWNRNSNHSYARLSMPQGSSSTRVSVVHHSAPRHYKQCNKSQVGTPTWSTIWRLARVAHAIHMLLGCYRS